MIDLPADPTAARMQLKQAVIEALEKRAASQLRLKDARSERQAARQRAVRAFAWMAIGSLAVSLHVSPLRLNRLSRVLAPLSSASHAALRVHAKMLDRLAQRARLVLGSAACVVAGVGFYTLVKSFAVV